MSLANAYATVIRDAEAHGAGRDFAEKLIAFMHARGHGSLMPRVIKLLEREPKQEKAVVTLARESDAQKFTDSLAAALNAFGVSKGEYAILVDPDMVGGYRVQSGHRLLDRSFRSALVSIYQNTIRQ